MAPNTRSQSTIVEGGESSSNLTPLADPTTGVAEPTMTITHTQFNQMMDAYQQRHRQQDETDATAAADTIMADAQLTSETAGAAPPAGDQAAANLVKSIMAEMPYRHRPDKPDRYSGRSKGEYNRFISLCETNFDAERNHRPWEGHLCGRPT